LATYRSWTRKKSTDTGTALRRRHEDELRLLRARGHQREDKMGSTGSTVEQARAAQREMEEMSARHADMKGSKRCSLSLLSQSVSQSAS
jgi:hypothetical protein